MSEDVVIDLEIPRPVAAARAAAAEFRFGDVIPMEWLLQKFGVEIPDTGTRAQFQKIQFRLMEYTQHFQDELLLNHKIALRNVRGRGYELVRPTEQAEFAIQTLRREIGRELERAGRILTHVRLDLLDSDQRKQTADAAGRLAAINAFVGEKARLTKQ